MAVAASRVVVASGEEERALLAEVLERAGLWASLERAAGGDPAGLRVLIKPDLTLFDPAAPTCTAAALVEELIDRLHERGYEQAAVGIGRSPSESWLENRDPLVLADLAGYRFVTAAGHAYEVADLGEDLVDAPFPEGSLLHGRPLARAWVEAGYRIGFAKNRTDEENLYSLGVQNLLDVPMLAAPQRAQAPEVCAEVLRFTPLHFAIVDAWESWHGGAGACQPRRLATRTLIAGESVLLCDWAAALKMGVDPYGSPVNARALRAMGLPEPYEIAGDLTPYEGWVNVPPALAESVRRRNASPTVARVTAPWFQPVDRELFPFKNPLDERVHAAFARVLSGLDGQPLALWSRVALNHALATAHEGVAAAAVLYAKDRLHWQERPLGLDLSRYGPGDYEAVVRYMEPLEDLAGSLPADENGLSWRYLDSSVLFRFSRVIPVPYEELVARVDISQAVRFMNDYIGGACVPVLRDAQGRIVHQAERNLYLPQPNYLVLSGGTLIDVAKLEHVRYGERERKISWQTVQSENGSAVHDDGSVTFAALGENSTDVTVVGRQQFTLPPFWQAVNLDRFPAVKDALMAQAYTEFFARTLANFEAAYEGREFRVGRPWDEDGGRWSARAGEVLGALAGRIAGARGQLREALGPAAAPAGQRDERGFVHFPGRPAAPPAASAPTGGVAAAVSRTAAGMFRQASVEALALLLDLREAVRKDVGDLPGQDEPRR